MFEWHKKEKPFLGMAGLGGGVVSKLVHSVGGGIEATGGFINNYTVSGTHYRSHIFTTSGTLEITKGEVEACDFLVVGGGGGGGISASNGHGGNGGGGAGGFVEGNALPLAVGTYTITVGQGGGGAAVDIPGFPGSSANERTGQPSSISGPLITTITAYGGGGGGEDNSDTVGPGGSGGGGWGGGGAGINSKGSATQPGTNSLYGATDYGNPGGAANGPISPAYCAAGGGGAGGPGEFTPNPSTAGRGGDGRANTFAYGPTNPQVYAGGGAGGASPYGGSEGGAPSNGGGGGASRDIGEYSTGGGGGGHGAPYSIHGDKCHGGSGIVVVRYEVPSSAGSAKATGGIISFYNGKTIHTFLKGGQFNVGSAAIPGAEVVIVGGGGSGGVEHGGGGGAGGVVHHPNLPFAANTPYTVTVGKGGSGGSSTSGNDGNWQAGEPGQPSSLTHPNGPYVAYRGGGGGTWTASNGHSGGSGGGAGGNTAPGITVNPHTNPGATEHGNAGGAGVSSPDFGAGGGGGAGGAGQAGNAANSSRGGTGGIGWQLPATFQDPAVAPSNTTGQNTYQRGGGLGTPGPNGGFYIAAGGGGCGGSTFAGGHGGHGGGGHGGIDAAFIDQYGHALENTGSGGGGGGNNTLQPYKFNSGRGGSGIVLIAYPS